MRIRFKIGKGKGQDLDPIAELGLESADEFFTDQPDNDLELVGLDVAESDQAEAELEPVTFIANEPDQPGFILAESYVAQSDQAEAELEPVISSPMSQTIQS